MPELVRGCQSEAFAVMLMISCLECSVRVIKRKASGGARARSALSEGVNLKPRRDVMSKNTHQSQAI